MLTKSPPVHQRSFQHNFIQYFLIVSIGLRTLLFPHLSTRNWIVTASSNLLLDIPLFQQGVEHLVTSAWPCTTCLFESPCSRGPAPSCPTVYLQNFKNFSSTVLNTCCQSSTWNTDRTFCNRLCWIFHSMRRPRIQGTTATGSYQHISLHRFQHRLTLWSWLKAMRHLSIHLR